MSSKEEEGKKLKSNVKGKSKAGIVEQVDPEQKDKVLELTSQNCNLHQYLQSST